jgi:hypothetical protein
MFYQGTILSERIIANALVQANSVPRSRRMGSELKGILSEQRVSYHP